MAHGAPGSAPGSPTARLIARSGVGLARLALVASAIAVVLALAAIGRPGADYRHADFFQFWAAPRLLLEGRDPYDPAAWSGIYAREAAPPVASPPPPGRHIYPPWSAVVLVPLGAAPLPLAASAWLVAQLAVVAWALGAFARAAGLHRREVVLLFGLAAAFEPLWVLAAGGNVTGFMLGAFVAALLAALAGRPTVAGVALALLAVKPHLFLVAAPAVLAVTPPPARPRALLAGALCLVALVAATVPFGSALTLEWLSAAVDLQATTGSNATVWTLGRVLPGGPLLPPLLAAAAVAVLVIWWRRSDRGPLDLVAGAIAISVFVAPHGWSYDQVLLLLPIAVVLRDVGTLPDRTRLPALLLLFAAGVIVPWTLYAVALGRSGEEWSALTGPLVLALLVAGGAVRTMPPAPARVVPSRL